MNLYFVWFRVATKVATLIWSLFIVSPAALAGHLHEDIPIDKLIDIPRSVLGPSSIGVKVQISSDCKYVFATFMESGTSSPMCRANVVAWTYPEGKFVKQESVYLEGEGSIGNHFLYESPSQKLISFESNEMRISSLADPEAKSVLIRLRPEFSAFNRYTVWQKPGEKSVMHFSFSKSVAALPLTLLEVPTDPAQKQTKRASPPVRDISFAAYSKRLDSLLVSQPEKDEYRARIWSLADNKVRDFPSNGSSSVTSCAFHDDGDKIIVGMDSGELSFVKLSKNKIVTNIAVADLRITDISIIDNSKLVTVSRDSASVLALVDYEQGKILRQYGCPKNVLGQNDVVTACCTMKDSRILYAILARNKVIIGSMPCPVKR